jgi:hypothetical protein
MVNIVYGQLSVNLRCLLCCKKIKQNIELNSKYGQYHKKCFEIDNNYNVKYTKKSKYNINTTIDINETIINFD